MKVMLITKDGYGFEAELEYPQLKSLRYRLAKGDFVTEIETSLTEEELEAEGEE